MDIAVLTHKRDDYISLTDMAIHRDKTEARTVISNWMSTYYTLEYLAIWEDFHNPNFNRLEYQSVRNEPGRLIISPKQWIERTNAIGIISKSGRYGGGIFAHKDIAFEFATWLSAKFKFYLVKEFQRLKEEEVSQQSLEWNLQRTLSKINYRIHTDAIKEEIIPLSNMESINALLIRQGLPQGERLMQLNSTAITQMKSLTTTSTTKQLNF